MTTYLDFNDSLIEGPQFLSQSKENNEDGNDEFLETAEELDLNENAEKSKGAQILEQKCSTSITSPDSRKRKASKPLIADIPKEKRASFKNCTFSSQDLILLLQSGAHFEDCKFE